MNAQRMLQQGQRPTEDMERELDTLLGQIQGRQAYQRLLASQENFDKIMGRVNDWILEGIEKGWTLSAPPVTGTNVGGEHVPRAPRTLIETTRIFQQSRVARDWFGDDFVDHFAATREWEWRQWLDGVTDWELKRYFEII